MSEQLNAEWFKKLQQDCIEMMDSPEMALVHPGYSWRGFTVPLHNFGSRLILRRAIKQGDGMGWISISLLYILCHNISESNRLSSDQLRDAIMKWAIELNLNDEEEEQAGLLVEQILKDSRAGQVRTHSDGEPSGKA
jgi:hypothetical protein